MSPSLLRHVARQHVDRPRQNPYRSEGACWCTPSVGRQAHQNPENARWLEEPFAGHDLEGPARLAAEVDIPITGGELGKSIHQLLACLTHETYDVLQPDARICAGILNARKISILAEAFHVPCMQHGTQGLSLAGYIQAGCAMPNCEFQGNDRPAELA